MRRFTPPHDAPESWKLSFHYDRMEIFGESAREGYARAYAVRRESTLDLIRTYARAPARVIDIAAAQGNFSLALAELGYDVTWNDLRGELAEYVERKRTSGKIEYLPGNAFEIAPAAAYDVVLITEVIEHVAHPDEFLANAARLLSPGGTMVMTTPNGAYFRNRLPRFSECDDPSKFEAVQFRPDADGHIFLLHDDEVLRLAQSVGLEVLEYRFYNNPLTIGALGMRHALRYLPNGLVKCAEQVSQQIPARFGRKILTGMGWAFRSRMQD